MGSKQRLNLQRSACQPGWGGRWVSGEGGFPLPSARGCTCSRTRTSEGRARGLGVRVVAATRRLTATVLSTQTPALAPSPTRGDPQTDAASPQGDPPSSSFEAPFTVCSLRPSRPSLLGGVQGGASAAHVPQGSKRRGVAEAAGATRTQNWLPVCHRQRACRATGSPGGRGLPRKPGNWQRGSGVCLENGFSSSHGL